MSPAASTCGCADPGVLHQRPPGPLTLISHTSASVPGGEQRSPPTHLSTVSFSAQVDATSCCRVTNRCYRDRSRTTQLPTPCSSGVANSVRNTSLQRLRALAADCPLSPRSSLSRPPPCDLAVLPPARSPEGFVASLAEPLTSNRIPYLLFSVSSRSLLA